MATTLAQSIVLNLVLVLGLTDLLEDRRVGRSIPFESFGRAAGVRNHQGWTNTEHLRVQNAGTFAVVTVMLKKSRFRYAEDRVPHNFEHTESFTTCILRRILPTYSIEPSPFQANQILDWPKWSWVIW